MTADRDPATVILTAVTTRNLDPQIAALIRRGEAAYTAMYACQPPDLAELCDDAIALLDRAGQLAAEHGDAERAVALWERCEHVRAVYRQLRAR